MLNRLVIETVMSREVRVFAGEHGALKLRRNLFQRHPDLNSLRLLTIAFSFANARFNHGRCRRIFIAQIRYARQRRRFEDQPAQKNSAEGVNKISDNAEH